MSKTIFATLIIALLVNCAYSSNEKLSFPSWFKKDSNKLKD